MINRAFFSRISRIVFLTLTSLFVYLCFVLFSAPVLYAAQVTLAWDGSTDPNLGGYKVYYGTASHNYQSNNDTRKNTTSTVSNLQDGITYYFAVTAYDAAGIESGYSNEVSYSATATCPYAISPLSQSVVSAGGPGTVSVTTQSGCAWTAVSNASWMSITSNSSGSESRTVNYSVSANPATASRSGTMTIAGNTLTVTQSGAACSPSISPASQTVSSAGGTVSVNVTAAGGCSWNASSSVSWVTLKSGGSGSGSGTASFSVSANPGSSSRSGSVTVAGQTFMVTQSGVACSYSVSPASQTVSSAGGTVSVSVTAPGGCSWSASSDVSWVSVTPASSPPSGSGNATFSVSPNATAASRMGTLTVAGQSFTVTQSGVACSPSISPTSQTVSSAGGTVPVNVTAPGGCSWSASSSVSWVTLQSGSSGSGNGTASFSVLANSGSSSRSGSVTVAGQTFMVTQSGVACSYSISPTSQTVSSTGGTVSVSVTAPGGCSWSASSSVSWVTLQSGSSGSGSGTANYSVLANPGSSSRSGSVTVAGQSFTVTQSGVLQYTLSVTKNGTGTGTVITPATGMTFNAGTAVNLTANPDASSTFGRWSGGYTGTSPTCSVIMNSDVSVTATFDLKSYAITATAGANGSISPQGTIPVNYGAGQSFTITPNPGYQVAEVKADGNSVGVAASYLFGQVMSNHTILASFTPSTVPPSGLPPSGVANLLSNGGFETGDLSGWKDRRGFTVGDQAAYSGKYGAKLSRSGRIYQVFNTVVGKTYYVSAGVRIDQQINSPSSGGLVIRILDSSGKILARSPYLTTNNYPTGSWTRVNFSFTAKTSHTRLVFRIEGTGRFNASGDDFIVSPDPIPDTSGILAASSQ